MACVRVCTSKGRYTYFGGTPRRDQLHPAAGRRGGRPHVRVGHAGRRPAVASARTPTSPNRRCAGKAYPDGGHLHVRARVAPGHGATVVWSPLCGSPQSQAQWVSWIGDFSKVPQRLQHRHLCDQTDGPAASSAIFRSRGHSAVATAACTQMRVATLGGSALKLERASLATPSRRNRSSVCEARNTHTSRHICHLPCSVTGVTHRSALG